MKTKTIYHLNYDCDKVVRIEVIQKSKKKKKRPIVLNLERVIGNYNAFTGSKPSLDNPCGFEISQSVVQVPKLVDLIREAILKAVHQAKPEDNDLEDRNNHPD
ncbi:hypothetical protein ACTS94_05140 [Empedobacter falsenii]